MNYSGVLVSAFPGRYDEMLRELDTIERVWKSTNRTPIIIAASS